MANTTKFVYGFGGGTADGSKEMKSLLGGKGANLAEMSTIGLPVPPGFTVTTEACNYYSQRGHVWPDGLEQQVTEELAAIESALGRRLGDPDRPLLVSVRSGAAQSMPGMMDTVLNLGLNDDVVQGLARETGNARFAFDAYRRFIDMFGAVVMDVHHDLFEHALEEMKKEKGVTDDLSLDADDLRRLVDIFKDIYGEHTQSHFPTDPMEQLRLSIKCRVRLVGQCARCQVPPDQSYHRASWNCSECPGNGLRQLGLNQRYRCMLHAQPVYRRAAIVRRVPGQRAGRGCRSRYPNSRAH